MKSLFILIVGSILLFTFGCSPKPIATSTAYSTNHHKGRYASQKDEGSKVLYESYHEMIEKTVDGKFVRKQFYPETKQITHYETYLDRKLRIKEGPNKEWMDNGKLYFEGQYLNDAYSGEWKNYSIFTGAMNNKGSYKNGKKEGLWKGYHLDGKTLIAQRNYIKGIRNGVYKKFDKEGNIVEEGIYKDGEIASRNIIVKDSKFLERDNNDPRVEQMPLFNNDNCNLMSDYDEKKKCAEIEMLKFIYSRIRYPAVAREEGVQGQALASFIVNKKGEVIEETIHRGICLDVRNEVMRIIKKMPNWVPGIKDGEQVEVRYKLPVRFKLEN